MVSVLGGPSERARRSRAASVVLALLALALGVVGLQHPANADQGGSGGEGVANMTLQLSLAKPGDDPSWGDTWPEQQAPPNFECGDVVTLLARIESLPDTGAGDTERTVAFELWLDAVASGTRPGQGFTEVLDAWVLGDDDETTDAGAYVQSKSPAATPFVEGATTTATIVVEGISAPETVIVRIDALVGCSDTEPRGGALYGGITADSFKEIDPGDRVLGSGGIRIQLLQPLDEGDTEPVITTPETTTTTTTAPTPTTAPPPEVTSTTSAPVQQFGAVTVQKVADRTTAEVGELIRYTISVTNSGTLPLTDVRVDDPRASFSTIIPTLGPGETAIFTPEYTVTSGDLALGQVVNEVTVSGNGFDPAIATSTVIIGGEVVFNGVSVATPFRATPTTAETQVLGISLPRTGSETSRMTWWAAALLVAGASVLTAANGRRDLDARRRA